MISTTTKEYFLSLELPDQLFLHCGSGFSCCWGSWVWLRNETQYHRNVVLQTTWEWKIFYLIFHSRQSKFMHHYPPPFFKENNCQRILFSLFKLRTMFYLARVYCLITVCFTRNTKYKTYRPGTIGIDMAISNERIILLDAQPVLSMAVLDRLIRNDAPIPASLTTFVTHLYKMSTC